MSASAIDAIDCRCPRCGERTTTAQWHAGQLVVVEAIPALVHRKCMSAELNRWERECMEGAA